MIAKIEAQEQSIGSIFSDAYEFEIPPYQRPYAWEDKQAKELLSDILDAMDNQDLNGGLYFLGSIVLVKLPTEALAKVIDGQQRLTTLTILLSALRDLTTDPETRIDRRRYIYQKANADRGLSARYRLLLRDADRPFFLKYIQDPGATDRLPEGTALEGSQKCITDNARLFRSHLEALPEARRNDLTAFIIQRCYLVVVAVPTPETARRIFTVLNARGLDLTPTDILKAELLERVDSPRAERALAVRWEQAERDLGRDQMVELFGHIRMIFERDKPRVALEEGFKRSVAPFSADAEKFFSDVLEPLADAYLLLSDATGIQKQFGSEAAKAIRSLARIDSKDWVPPALLCLWKSQSSSPTRVASFLIDLERIAYFLFVTRAGINERIARFARVMDDVDPRAGGAPSGSGIELTDAEQYAFLRALDSPLYQLTRVCKPVLQRLDEALSTGGASYDQLVSIEHVLPQTVDPESEWARLFTDASQRAEWTHRIGNLVFLTHRVNIRASNWDFERKKTQYFGSTDGASPFVITQGVLRTPAWTAEHIENRQRELLLKLCEVWRLDEGFLTAQPVEPTKQKGVWVFTDGNIINSKRDQITQALSQREGIPLKRKGALCASEDEQVRAVCSISKRYSAKPSVTYWYGYATEWRNFLLRSEKSFLVLGCVDRESAFAIPVGSLEKWLPDLHRSSDRHWHIVLDENDHSGLDLVLRSGSRFSLDRFELRLNALSAA